VHSEQVRKFRLEEAEECLLGVECLWEEVEEP
jgi:hypothetical protein